MIELVLIYCLSAVPDRCLERHELLEGPVDAMSCTLRAQTSAQDYLAMHPTYRLAKWRCEPDKPRESPA